ncbi:MAG: translocation/assembly module TamB domain-containing protein, partial [Verrucomicrobiota bacterium]
PLPQFLPQIRRIDGTAALDLHLSGSPEKPLLKGSASLNLKSARLANDSFPPLNNFQGRFSLENDSLRLNTLSGEVGGGSFNASGSVAFPNLSKPNLNLRLQSKSVLLLRNDSITLRADSDIHLDGPLPSAALTGSLFLTQSRFFKEIDILPIALPGRNSRPTPRSVQSRYPSISFPQFPFRDWKLDLAIKTHPDDPFRLRGNLTNGAAVFDLKLAGTGLEPYLTGSIRLTDFTANLPFSKLVLTRGLISFKQDDPFQPKLDIQADSQFRSQLVHASIYGSTADPQVQLTSEPPLPYADLVALLATGTTASALGSSPDALASRAAMLALQKLYHQLFNRNQSVSTPENKQDLQKFTERFDLQLGGLNPKTNSQEINSSFRIRDDLYFLGDIDNEGRFTGSFQYLIRFR